MVASKTNGEPRNRPVGTRNHVSRRFDAHRQGPPYFASHWPARRRSLLDREPGQRTFAWMASYVLVPGAGGDEWYWHRLVPALRERGHDAVAVALPAADDSAGWSEYADVIVDAIGDRPEPVLVAQSLGGFSAPLAATRKPVDEIVLLNAMIPKPGETGEAWWANTGQREAQLEYLGDDRRHAGGCIGRQGPVLPRHPARRRRRGGASRRPRAVMDADDAAVAAGNVAGNADPRARRARR
jgi:alpha-beta hydrolase superfamily lysophospholipase